MGEVVRATDALNGTTQFTYDATGNRLSVSSPQGVTETITYDLRGRKVALSSPDSGSWTYAYNGAGELTRQEAGSQGACDLGRSLRKARS